MKPNQTTMLQQVFITYSAVILSFLSGVLWGSAIDRFSNALSNKALIFSNVFALMAIKHCATD